MKARKIFLVARQVKMDEEDGLDVGFWLSRPVSERIAEITRLRQEYYRWLHGSYPEHIEKIISRRRLNKISLYFFISL
jgi:hypothetical protein